MLDRLAVWRHKPGLWAIPLVFVTVNILVLTIFQTAFSGRVDALKLRYDKQAERLENLRSESDRAERFIAAVEAQEIAGEDLYDVYFANEGTRFTSIITAVRKQAREAGLNPLKFSYPKDEVEDYGLVRRGINFPITGTYEQLRRFINLLELSDEFVTLEAVQLGEVRGARGGNADPRISVRLRLSTMFVDTEYVVEPASEEGLPPEEDETEMADEET